MQRSLPVIRARSCKKCKAAGKSEKRIKNKQPAGEYGFPPLHEPAASSASSKHEGRRDVGERK
jgi:hypothetical protein